MTLCFDAAAVGGVEVAEDCGDRLESHRKSLLSVAVKRSQYVTALIN